MPLQPLPATGPAATPTCVTDPKAGPGNQTVPVSIVLVGKMKRWMRKSGCLGRKGTCSQTEEEEDKAGYSKAAGLSDEQEGKEEDTIKASITT